MESQLIIIFFHPIKLPVLGLGYIKLSFWPKGSHRNPQIIRLLQKWWTALSKLMTSPHTKYNTYTNHWTWEAELMPTWRVHPYILESLVQKCTQHATKKRKINTNQATKLLIYNGGTEPVRVTSECLIWPKACSMRQNAYSTLLRLPKSRD